MAKWISLYLIVVIAVIAFQLVAIKGLGDAITLELDLDWDYGIVTPVDDGLPDV